MLELPWEKIFLHVFYSYVMCLGDVFTYIVNLELQTVSTLSISVLELLPNTGEQTYSSINL